MQARSHCGKDRAPFPLGFAPVRLSKDNLSTSLENAENYTNKWKQVVNKNKTDK